MHCQFQERVEALYLFRDQYFETHSINEAINRRNDVEKEMKDALSKFDECKGYEIDGSRAKYYYLKGRALNVMDRFSSQAEELLSKAVKLEPNLIEAWNELGECYWKNNDIKQAKNCFVGALQYVCFLYLRLCLQKSLIRDCLQYICFFFNRIEIKCLYEICQWYLDKKRHHLLHNE